MPTPKAFIFDLGNTLIHTQRAEPFQQRLEELGASRDLSEIQDAFDYTDRYFMKNYPGELGQDPAVFYGKYLSLMLAYLHVLNGTQEELYRLVFEKSPPRSSWIPYEETIPFLRELHARGSKVGLLTNWDLGARALLHQLGLDGFFQSIVVSSEIGAEKPSPKGFLLSLEELGVSPEEALYVGDNYYDDVKGANGVGMRAALLNRTKWHSSRMEGNYLDITSLSELLSLPL